MEGGTGNNAIIVVPGAASDLCVAEIEAQSAVISGAAVFMTQLETPLAVSRRGLEIAREAGVTTILNPAPAADLAPEIYRLIDYFTPNETEAALLTALKRRFDKVRHVKPPASRKDSRETYVVATGFRG